jgi:hypothetical protein
MYHVAILIGRILLRQPASHWPPFSCRMDGGISPGPLKRPLAPDLPTRFYHVQCHFGRRTPGTAWRGHGHLRRVRSPAHCVPVGNLARDGVLPHRGILPHGLRRLGRAHLNERPGRLLDLGARYSCQEKVSNISFAFDQHPCSEI